MCQIKLFPSERQRGMAHFCTCRVLCEAAVWSGSLRRFAPHQGKGPISLSARSAMDERPLALIVPLRRFAVIPSCCCVTFFPASHAKHGAAPKGAFDWRQERTSPGVGMCPTSDSGYPKGYPESLLACSKIYRLKQPSTCAIMHSKTGRQIDIYGGTNV